MLTIICGENSVSSRKYFLQLKESYSKKDFEIKNITTSEISELKKWLIESVSLFSQKRIFFVENLSKFLKRFKKKDLVKELTNMAVMKDVEIISWEEVSSRELVTIKGAQIKEFKISESIFKLLDACYPQNKVNFLKLLDQLVQDSDENFIFVMLARHIRNLILIKQGIIPQKMQSWQASRLKVQASFWPLAKLISFYTSLFRVDVRAKTNTSALSVKESLDILGCLIL